MSLVYREQVLMRRHMTVQVPVSFSSRYAAAACHWYQDFASASGGRMIYEATPLSRPGVALDFVSEQTLETSLDQNRMSVIPNY